MIRHIKKPIKPLWYIVALAIIFLAVLIQAARLFIPHISQFHTSLESFASQQTGSLVRFGELNASWYGLRPKVTVDNLKIQTTDKQPVVTVQHANLELDILSSLFHWVPVWRKVELQGLSLSVNQDEKGGWSVGGLSPNTDGGLGWRYRSPGALFLMANQVDIDTSQVTFLFHNQRQFTTDIPSIKIENNGQFHRLSAQASIDKGQLDNQGSLFTFVLEGIGDPSDAEHFFAKAHLDFNDFPVERLAFLLTQVTDSKEVLPKPVSGSTVDMNVWFDFTSPSRFLLSGDVELSTSKATDFSRNNFLDIPFKAKLFGDYAIDSGLTIGLREARIDDKIDLSDSIFTIHDGKLTAAIKQLDLAIWDQWSRDRIIRSSKVKEVLESLSLEGMVENIHVDIDFADVWNTHIKANVTNVTLDAWNNVPAFKNVTGFVDSNLREGFIFLESQAFELHANKIYPQPLLFDHANGYVSWVIPSDKTDLKIYGQKLSVKGEFGHADGNFLLSIPHPSLNEHSNLILQIGLQDSAAKFHRQLTPDVLPEDLTEWMNGAIKAGDVKQAGFFYRGGFSEGSDRTVQLYGELEDGQLAFSSDWPEINKIQGHFLLDNKRLRAAIDHSSFYSDDRLSGSLEWNWHQQQKLVVDASGRSGAQSALKFVNESWLYSKTNGVFDGWSGEGEVDLSLNLSLPILDDSAESWQKIKLGFNNNRIHLKEQSLLLDKVEGTVFYQTGRGFTSDNLETEVFDYILPLSFTGGVDDLIVSGSANASIKSLSDWLEKPLDNILTGVVPYTLNLKVPLGEVSGNKETPVLMLSSDLKDVTVDLPAPFGKVGGISRPASIKINYFTQYSRYDFRYDKLVDGRWIDHPEKVPQVVIDLNDVKADVSKKKMSEGVKVYGSFNKLDIKVLYESYNKLDFASQKTSGDLIEFPVGYELAIKEAIYGEYNFKDIKLSGQREDTGWLSIIDSDFIKGGVYIDDKAQPLVVNMDYFRWPPPSNNDDLQKQKSVPEGVDPLADFDASGLISADINIKAFYYKEKNLGEWSLQFRPDDDGIDLRNIYANVGGLSLIGSNIEQGAYLRWQFPTAANAMSTRFIGRLSGGNLNDFFNQLKLSPLLESKKTDVYTELSWDGSPLNFSIKHLNGIVDIKLEEGVFVQEKTNEATDALKLLGLMNFDTWGRRIRLDFSDLYKKGFVFDDFTGKLSFDNGVIRTAEPIAVNAPSSKLVLMGTADSLQEKIDAELKATLPIAGNLTVATALAGGLPAAAGVFVVSKLFGKQIDKASTIGYRINGTWDDPVVQVDRPKQEEGAIEVEESGE
ncbi:MAG: YhdP family protein [Cellvibrionaceae bacterium]